MHIFVTRKLPQIGLDLLQKHHTIEVNSHDRVLTKQEILKGVKGKEGLVCLLTDTIDRDIIEVEPNLKMIANYAVGFNNIDIDAATEHKIPVSNTPDVLTDATAEMAWALLFSVSRRIIESDRLTRAGRFKGWDPMLLHGMDITGKTLGVIGAGRIGTAFAMKSKGFSMKILYTDQKKNETLEQELDATQVSLETLLQQSDFISVHVPLLDNTFHLIGEKELHMMKEHAVFINTSRGPVVHEKALINALQQNRIFGAGLDVYEYEPDVPKGLIELDNVVLQPHSASATVDARTNMALITAENMLAGLNGEIPPNCVNQKVFDKDVSTE